jgi:hypothetical protein
VSLGLRLSIGVAVACVTAVSLGLFGLTMTSGAIEVVVFAWGIGVWMFLGARRRRVNTTAGPTLKRVAARKKLTVDQEGPSPTVSGALAGEIDVRQRSVDR